MKKLIVVVLLCSSLLSSLVSAGTIDIYAPGVGNRTVQGDANGTLYGTERFPRPAQFSSLVVLNAVALTAGNTSIGSYTNIGSDLAIRLLVTGNGTSTVYVRFKGSFDGITFAYLSDRITSGANDSPSYTSTLTDTFQVKLVGIANVSPGQWLPFTYRDGSRVIFPFLQAEAVCPTGANTTTFTVEFGQRGY